MSNSIYTQVEQEMINFDFTSLDADVKTAKQLLTAKIDLSGGLEKICAIWQKIGKFVKLLEKVPIVGKYISILAEVLDSICPSA